MAWHNNDGLYIKYGTEVATPARGGEVNTDGNMHEVIFEVQGEDIPAVSAPLYLSDTYIIPAGAIIDELEMTVIEATVGTNANWDIGLAKLDRTEYDYNGLVAAGDGIHEAAVGTKETYTQGSTEHGAVLGIVVAFDSYVTINYDTAALTDGVLQIRIRWFVPVTAS